MVYHGISAAVSIENTGHNWVSCWSPQKSGCWSIPMPVPWDPVMIRKGSRQWLCVLERYKASMSCRWIWENLPRSQVIQIEYIPYNCHWVCWGTENVTGNGQLCFCHSAWRSPLFFPLQPSLGNGSKGYTGKWVNLRPTIISNDLPQMEIVWFCRRNPYCSHLVVFSASLPTSRTRIPWFSA